MFLCLLDAIKNGKGSLMNLNKLKEVVTMISVGTIGIVNGLDRFHFVEEINKKVKNDGKEVKDDRVI